MALDVGLGRCPAKARDVLMNESEVLELALRWLQSALTRWRGLRNFWRCSIEFDRASVCSETRAICEVNDKLLGFARGHVRNLLTLQRFGEQFGAEISTWHGAWGVEFVATRIAHAGLFDA